MIEALGHPLFYLAFWCVYFATFYFWVAKPYLRNQEAILLALLKLCDIMKKRDL